MSTSLLNFLPYLSTILAICITAGGMFAFRNGQQNTLSKFQKDTIDAMQSRIDLLASKMTDCERENAVQRYVLETITTALAQRGIIITVNGDMVTVRDKNSGTTTHRKRSPSSPNNPTIKKEKDTKDEDR